MAVHPILIYLDTCCLNRPLDDASQERIRLEAEAVRTILRLVGLGQISWVTSEVLEFEAELNPDADRRDMVFSTLAKADRFVTLEESTIRHAEELEEIGIKPMDALHLASARAGKARVFLTVDDALLRKAKKFEKKVGIRVRNPLDWVGDLA